VIPPKASTLHYSISCCVGDAVDWTGLHVEYAKQGKEYGILFICSLFCEYSHLEYERIQVIYRVNQAAYVIRILVIAPQEYVNIDSTRRLDRPTTRAKFRDYARRRGSFVSTLKVPCAPK